MRRTLHFTFLQLVACSSTLTQVTAAEVAAILFAAAVLVRSL